MHNIVIRLVLKFSCPGHLKVHCNEFKIHVREATPDTYPINVTGWFDLVDIDFVINAISLKSFLPIFWKKDTSWYLVVSCLRYFCGGGAIPHEKDKISMQNKNNQPEK